MHPETGNYLKVNAWFAYPNYGIGYLLSSGTFGELMPDKSALFYNPLQTQLYYYEPSDKDKTHQASFGLTPTPKLLPDKLTSDQPCLECFKVLDDHMLPKQIQKKHKLLKRFKKELTVSVVEDLIPSYFTKFETISQIKQHHAPIFVENIRIKK